MSASEIELLKGVAKLLREADASSDFSRVRRALKKLENAMEDDDHCDYCGHRQSE
jgi:hypothetical protein